MRLSRRLLGSLMLASVAIASGSALAEDTVTVFAAASLKNALDAAALAFTAKTGTAIRTSYAGS